MRYGDTLTLTYTPTPGDNPLRTDATGTKAPAVTDTAPQSIANDTPKATEATLKTLSLNVGTLVPEFSAAVTLYNVFVEPTVRRVMTVSAAQTDSKATISISPRDAHPSTMGHQVEFEAAPSVTVITVLVTAEDGDSTLTYTMTVTHGAPQSSDATLSALSLTHGTSAVTVTLKPPFVSTINTYTASVANSVSSLTVTAKPSAESAAAIIKLGGTVDLTVGANVITVEVTAEDGETTQTYTVTVTCAAPPLSADASWAAWR